EAARFYSPGGKARGGLLRGRFYDMPPKAVCARGSERPGAARPPRQRARIAAKPHGRHQGLFSLHRRRSARIRALSNGRAATYAGRHRARYPPNCPFTRAVGGAFGAAAAGFRCAGLGDAACLPAPFVATARFVFPPAFATGTTSLVTRTLCPAASASFVSTGPDRDANIVLRDPWA
ncbi:MAG: hypothetical protein ABI423_14605, partial [Burkholderiales bacterium]